MNSLNLRNLLLTCSAIVLTIFIMAFPTYLFMEIFRSDIATAILFIIFAIGSSLIAYRIPHDNFMTTILKLSLFTSTYLLMLATLITYENLFSISTKFLLLISAIYFASMPLFFRNPFIRILTLTATLMIVNADVYLYFHELGTNNLLIINLVILIVFGLSNYAMRFYTLLIALSLNLLSWPLWESFGFRFADVSLTTPIIVYILLGLSFVPHLIYHWKNQSQQQNLLYILSIAGLLILSYFLSNSTIAGIVVIALGFYLQSRTLHIIGLLLFGYSLFMYYYNLENSLSAKGIILISTGIVILIARYVFHRFGKIHHEN